MTIHRSCIHCEEPCAVEIFHSTADAPLRVTCADCMERGASPAWWLAAVIMAVFCGVGWTFSEALHSMFPWAFRAVEHVIYGL